MFSQLKGRFLGPTALDTGKFRDWRRKDEDREEDRDETPEELEEETREGDES